MSKLDVRTADVIRYLKPLREGGSMPGLIHADDDFLYVLKFRGAGQRTKALTAELIGGLLAQKLGIKVPELVFLNLDDSFSRLEADEEIQDLLKFSVGLNLGLHFLSGAITYDPLVSNVDSFTASLIVLLDAMIFNIDRTVKNTNLLIWNQELWAIDHGASLYFHHNWDNWEQFMDRDFLQITDHVLLSKADQLGSAVEHIQNVLSEKFIEQLVNSVPEDWLIDRVASISTSKMRQHYITFLKHQLHKIESIAKLATNAQ